MHILVVDDDAPQRETLEVGLSLHGYRVTVAPNARKALETLEALEGADSPIDLVLTDHAMPGMSGLELLGRIRREYGALPVVMMTGYAEKEVAIHALNTKCDRFLEKPFTLNHLVGEIRLIEEEFIESKDRKDTPQLFQRLVHQINNPLQAIKGNAQLGIMELGKNKEFEKYLRRIIRASERIESINREIIQSTREQVSKHQKEKVDVAQLLRDCVDMFQELFRVRGVTVRSHLEGGPMEVWGNRFSLDQLFRNLVLNAAESMEEKDERLLTLRAQEDPQAGCVVVSVQDTGCGIDPGAKVHIFEPYYTTKRNGTGLGLSVVRRVVSMHRGAVEVSSTPGGGTTFTLRLPIVATGDESGSARTGQPIRETVAALRGQRKAVSPCQGA